MTNLSFKVYDSCVTSNFSVVAISILQPDLETRPCVTSDGHRTSLRVMYRSVFFIWHLSSQQNQWGEIRANSDNSANVGQFGQQSVPVNLLHQDRQKSQWGDQSDSSRMMIHSNGPGRQPPLDSASISRKGGTKARVGVRKSGAQEGTRTPTLLPRSGF